MTRDDILAIVKKEIVETVPDVNEDEIDPTRSMIETGANSLDIVEIVSAAMRELKVKIPRAELMTLQNLNELVDVLYAAVQAKEQAATEQVSSG